jgi:hypothetical protein
MIDSGAVDGWEVDGRGKDGREVVVEGSQKCIVEG